MLPLKDHFRTALASKTFMVLCGLGGVATPDAVPPGAKGAHAGVQVLAHIKPPMHDGAYSVRGAWNKHVDLSRANTYLLSNNQALRMLKSMWPRSLDFSGRSIAYPHNVLGTDFKGRFHKLARLDLKEVHMHDCSDIRVAFEGAPLKTLDLSFALSAGHRFAQLARFGSSLQELYLHCIKEISDQHLRIIASEFPLLRALGLHGTSITGHGLDALLAPDPPTLVNTLKFLDISCCKATEDSRRAATQALRRAKIVFLLAHELQWAGPRAMRHLGEARAASSRHLKIVLVDGPWLPSYWTHIASPSGVQPVHRGRLRPATRTIFGVYKWSTASGVRKVDLRYDHLKKLYSLLHPE